MLASKVQRYFPGVLVCVTIAMASTFIADHYGGPVMLFALLFGTAFHFLDEHENTQIGIDLCAKTLLRLGVALLGFRITVDQISALGNAPLLIVVSGVLMTIVLGVLMARVLGLSLYLGILASAAVAICGASAALAVAAVLPFYQDKERDTIFVVVVVTALSTLAMIFYPVFVQMLGLTADQMGIFLGGTIHDVAQVVGAGYSISNEVGDTSTVIKLFRVALLVPVVIIFSILLNHGAQQTQQKRSFFDVVPWFLLLFVLFVAINSSGVLASDITSGLSAVSRWLLIAAIAALGVKTSFQDLGKVGWQPIILMLFCTLVIAVFVWAMMVF